MKLEKRAIQLTILLLGATLALIWSDGWVFFWSVVGANLVDD